MRQLGVEVWEEEGRREGRLVRRRSGSVSTEFEAAAHWRREGTEMNQKDELEVGAAGKDEGQKSDRRELILFSLSGSA